MTGKLTATVYGGRISELVGYVFGPAATLIDEQTGAEIIDEQTGNVITA